MGLLDRQMGIASIAHSAFRFVQMIMALAVCGLYGTDLHAASKAHVYADGKWVFAVVTASLSAITALLYIIPHVSRVPMLFIWDTVLLFLWIAVFGLFGNMYIKEHAEGDAGVQRMKNAVWVDLTNLFLWLISAVGMALFWIRHRGGRSQFTGRATV